MPGHSGRGHRPCHSVPLIPGQPGAQSPRPAPDPAPCGRFPPAGSGAGLCRCGLYGSWWQRRARAGETQCVSWSRPDWGRRNIVRTTGPAAMAGVIAAATALRCLSASRGLWPPSGRVARTAPVRGDGPGDTGRCGRFSCSPVGPPIGLARFSTRQRARRQTLRQTFFLRPALQSAARRATVGPGILPGRPAPEQGFRRWHSTVRPSTAR